jgi:phage terminase large subunit
MNLKVTPVFEKNYNSTKKIVVNQGGSRSSKTYSICQLMFLFAQTEPNITLEVMRKTMPALKGSVMKDFIEIITLNDYWDYIDFNRTEHIFYFKESGSSVQFISLDQPQKKRGSKRKYLYLNEANEFTKEDWIQLILRMEDGGRIWMDYNPSDEFHWIYDEILTREDCEFIKSTYLDNPFLSDEQVKEIERLKDSDYNYWRVYGLGERGISEAVIYSHWQIYKEDIQFDEVVYGLDFGFNHPTALTQIGIKEDAIYWKELIYESNLTNSDLIAKLQIDRKKEIFADAAEPQRIEEIYRKGYNIKSANKSVKDGIDCVKSKKLFIHYESINLQKEIKSYKYKMDKMGLILDEPVKYNDDALDSARYGTYNYFLNKGFKPKTKFTVHKRH